MTAKQPTVLVVDDERGSRESLRMILSPHHHVLQAGSGAEALDALRTSPVELMTLDLNMPGMKGDDLMRVVRSEFPQVEIIVITGCGTLESATSGIRYGICDYLQKPFDVVQVTAAVMRALSRQRARTRLSSFLEELGEVVGKERDAHAILTDVERSQKLRGRLGGIFGERGPASEPGAARRSIRRARSSSSRCSPRRSRPRIASCAATRAASRCTPGCWRTGCACPPQDHEHVRIAAFLHDLGKVGVPTDLLLRAGALDANERHLVEQHPEIGARLIKPLDIPAAISARDPPPPRVVGRLGLSRWALRRGHPAQRAHHRRGGRLRRDELRPALSPRARAAGDHRRIQALRGTQFDPNLAKEILLLLDTGVWDVDPQLLAESVGRAAPAGRRRRQLTPARPRFTGGLAGASGRVPGGPRKLPAAGDVARCYPWKPSCSESG